VRLSARSQPDFRTNRDAVVVYGALGKNCYLSFNDRLCAQGSSDCSGVRLVKQGGVDDLVRNGAVGHAMTRHGIPEGDAGRSPDSSIPFFMPELFVSSALRRSSRPGRGSKVSKRNSAISGLRRQRCGKKSTTGLPANAPEHGPRRATNSDAPSSSKPIIAPPHIYHEVAGLHAAGDRHVVLDPWPIRMNQNNSTIEPTISDSFYVSS